LKTELATKKFLMEYRDTCCRDGYRWIYISPFTHMRVCPLCSPLPWHFPSAWRPLPPTPQNVTPWKSDRCGLFFVSAAVLIKFLRRLRKCAWRWWMPVKGWKEYRYT